MQHHVEQLRVTFLGAAQTVTGSMHLVEHRGHSYLLDCGLYLGAASHVLERNRQFPFDPRALRAVFLTHAHVDHCGNLPNLVRQGFTGPIYCTAATRDLLEVMLADSAKIQREEVVIEEDTTGPLYSGTEVARTITQCRTVEYDVPLDVGEGLTVRLLDAGHLLGSAMVVLTCATSDGPRTVTFTGDLGRANLHYLPPPAALPASDLIISESTYGGRLHPPLETLAIAFRELVLRTADRKGKVFVPAFSLGRTQLVVHFLKLWMKQKLLPHLPIFVDSPLAAQIMPIYRKHTSLLTAEARAGLPAEDEPDLHFVTQSRESRQLDQEVGPFIVVASGGMCDAGRILGHLDKQIDDPRNSIVLVSYQAPGSLGSRLLQRGPTVKHRGRTWNKWADVTLLNGFSGHADQAEFLAAFTPVLADSPSIRLVHGELEQSNALADRLRAMGFGDVDVPRREDSLRIA